MINKALPIEFQQAIPVIETIEQAGFEAYFVGGCVRDVVLGKDIHDVDIATSAFPAEIKQLFKKTIDVGIDHGTVLVLFENGQYEVTTFRTESTYQDYRRPDHVIFVRSLEEDLKRRDFTMNALAMDRIGHIIDLFNGIEAIEKKEIIAVGNPTARFNEDALRMLRGLRFSSQLNFDIEENTLRAIKENHRLLKKISVERICAEWQKLLLGAHRNKGLDYFIKTDCYSCCPAFHDKKDSLKKLLHLDDCHVFKNETIAWLMVVYYFNLQDVTSFLKKWKCSNQLIQDVTKSLTQLRARKKKEWSTIDLYKSGPFIIEIVEEAKFILTNKINPNPPIARYELLPIKSKSDLVIDGNDLLTALKKKPGRWLGELFVYLENQVVLEKVANERVDLINLSKKWERNIS